MIHIKSFSTSANLSYVYSHCNKVQILQSYHALKVLPMTTGSANMRIIVWKIHE